MRFISDKVSSYEMKMIKALVFLGFLFDSFKAFQAMLLDSRLV